MHIIWKRPDGFQNAQPSDFRRVELSNGAQLWLHLKERDWYPFQVSGDWSGQEDTKRLNRLVNVLGAEGLPWEEFLNRITPHTQEPLSLEALAQKNIQWIQSLKASLRGDTWEVEIIECALNDVVQQLMNL